jgi:phenylalanyl-tRNA synthetase beta chain
VSLFEFGPVFLTDRPSKTETGVTEELRLAVVMSGDRAGRWLEEDTAFDVHDVVGIMTAVLDRFGVHYELENHDGKIAYLHPGTGATARAGERLWGVVGQLHPQVASAFELNAPVFVFELNVTALFRKRGAAPKFQSIPRFPAATRDLALVVDRSLPYGAIRGAVAAFKNRLVESVELASLYEGDPIPPDKRSVALSVTYRSSTGSLTDQKIDAVHQRLISHICERVGADLR